MLNLDIEHNDSTTWSIGKRSNRYYLAPINISTYPKNLILASRGSINNLDTSTNFDCNEIRYSFVSENKSPKVYHAINHCGKLECHACGPYLASFRSKAIASRILGYLRTTSWRAIRFISFNIYDNNNSYWELKEHESIDAYIRRTKRKVRKIALEAGMEAFALIFHADRLECILDQNGEQILIKDENGELTPLMERVWSPHFHLIGCGYLIKSNEFYEKYKFTYKSQVSFSKYSQKDLFRLPGRIAYRLNHSAYSMGPKHARHAVTYAGGLTYSKFKVIKKEKYIENVKDENGFKYVAVNLNKFIKSKMPKYIKKHYSQFKNQCENFLKNPIHNGYLSLDLEHKQKHYENMKFEDGILIDNSWRNEPLDYVNNPKTGEKIYLVDVEILTEYHNQLNDNKSKVSTFEFIIEKRPHFEVLDPNFETQDSITEIMVKNVHERFNELKILDYD